MQTPVPFPCLQELIYPYPEKRSTWNRTNVPSKLAGSRRWPVISVHSLRSPLDLRKNTLTRHFEVFQISFSSPRRETGNWTVTGFAKLTTWEQLISSTGPNHKSCPSNSPLGTSCTFKNVKEIDSNKEFPTWVGYFIWAHEIKGTQWALGPRALTWTLVLQLWKASTSTLNHHHLA